MIGTQRDWYKRIPRERVENLKFRKHIRDKCRRSKAFQKAIIDACRKDLLFFISCFVFQYNGKDRGKKVGPFIAWDFQEAAVLEILRCTQEGEDVIIEKSRDMGASWLCLIIVTWFWLFHKWNTILVMSKSEAAVEASNSEALFWKIDFILSYLPDWMLQGYERRRHRKKLHFKHPNQSVIYGTSSTGRAGVGAKVTFMFIDEFSQIEEGREVLHRTADTTDCRIFNGTHRGTGTAFYELTDPGSAAGAYINKLVMHWSQHPEKRQGAYRYHEVGNRVEVLDTNYVYETNFQFVKTNEPTGGPYPGLRSPWYDSECPRRGNSRAVAMDLDIDPAGSVKQFFNAIMIRSLIANYACPPYWEAEFRYDPDTGKPIRMEKMVGGKCKLWIHFTSEGKPPLSTYVIGADPSQGTGATPTCTTVFDAEKSEKVLECADPYMDPILLASFLVALGWLFKGRDGSGAKVAWELQGPGATTEKTIKKLNYWNVYYRAKYKFTDQAAVAGWSNGRDAKLKLLNEYNEALQTRRFLNRSKAALEQCLRFMYTASGVPEHPQETNTDDPSGARANHGDLVMGDAIAWMLAKDLFIAPVKKLPPPLNPFNSMQGRRDMRAMAEREAEAW